MRLVRTDYVFNQYFVLIFIQSTTSSFIIQFIEYEANLMKSPFNVFSIEFHAISNLYFILNELE